MVLAVPHGRSKGQEQVLSPQTVGPCVILHAGKERVLASARGKPTPKLPRMVVSNTGCKSSFCNREMAAEKISVFGCASLQEPSWGGKGK